MTLPVVRSPLLKYSSLRFVKYFARSESHTFFATSHAAQDESLTLVLAAQNPRHVDNRKDESSFGRIDMLKDMKKPALSLQRWLQTTGEADGTRTRNTQIDSLVL